MELARENDPEFFADTRRLAEVAKGYVPFQTGDVLVAKITPCFQNGKGGIASNLTNGVGFGSTEFHVLRPGEELGARFLYYATVCKPFRDVGVTQMRGSAGQQRVPVEYLADFVLPIPSRLEQDAIVAFLDRKLAQIDSYIMTKRRQIELLEERKAIIIERHVFGSMESQELHATGARWLESIPHGWEMRRNGALFEERKEAGQSDLPVLMVSLRTGVTLESDETNRPRRLIKDRSKYRYASRGDIAFNMMRMWQGAVGVVPVDGNVSPAYTVCRPRAGVIAEYYERVFRTKRYQGEVFCNSYGIVPDRNRLYWVNFKAILSPYPPAEQQQAIVHRVQQSTSGLDQAIGRLEREITLMTEYRTVLIAEAVCGRLDVRQAD